MNGVHITLLVSLWLLGAVPALYIIAKEEQQRMPGKLFSHMIEEIKDKPFPALMGYSGYLFLGWFKVLKKLLKKAFLQTCE